MISVFIAVNWDCSPHEQQLLLIKASLRKLCSLKKHSIWICSVFFFSHPLCLLFPVCANLIHGSGRAVVQTPWCYAKYEGEQICSCIFVERTLVVLRGSEHSLEQQAAWDYFSGETARRAHFPADNSCRCNYVALREQTPLKFG